MSVDPTGGRYVQLQKMGLGASGAAATDDMHDIDAALAAFEAEERARLGLDPEDAPSEQWVEPIYSDPSTASKEATTILVSGLTMAHDYFVAGAVRGLGYTIVNLDCPDNEALRYGKEFGNRGQCNPTYFTVGNLVKYLTYLRDVKGIPTQQIIDEYVFMTAGSCGPCRFGMYVTEYRKALRDSGFDGFRVMLFEMQGGLKQASGEAKGGLVFDPPFFIAIFKALMVGDALNALCYRIRPYEIEEGATDRAMERSKEIVYQALNQKTSLLLALLAVRRELSKVKVDRTRVRPKVAIIGEFWAMTTEGDGSYQMPRFLQAEGAEANVQLVTAFVCFLVWEHIRDTRHRMTLRKDDAGPKGLEGKDGWKKWLTVMAADKALRTLFHGVAELIGLHGYRLPDMKELAQVAGDFYNNELRGGEGHMEVAKVILNVVRSKVNMTLSIKPFGCMPSSGVSDGVQSTITELYPEAIFLPIETTGDGAVNVYSRVQMMLFKAKKNAQREVDEVLEAYGMTIEDVQRTIRRVPLLSHPLLVPPHRHAATAADMAELVGTLRKPLTGLRRAIAYRRAKKARTLKRASHLA